MDIPPEITPEEELGRSVLSSREAKRADRKEIPMSVFVERGVFCLSSDRLTIAPLPEAIQIAEQRAQERGPDRSFYGWAIVMAEKARERRRRVAASPRPGNPYHADIILPSEEEQNQHALELARLSRWCRHRSS